MGTAFTRSNFHVGTRRWPVDRRNERPERGRSPDALARMAVTAKLGKAGPVAIKVAGLGHSVPEPKSATDRVALARRNLRGLRT